MFLLCLLLWNHNKASTSHNPQILIVWSMTLGMTLDISQAHILGMLLGDFMTFVVTTKANQKFYFEHISLNSGHTSWEPRLGIVD